MHPTKSGRKNSGEEYREGAPEPASTVGTSDYSHPTIWGDSPFVRPDEGRLHVPGSCLSARGEFSGEANPSRADHIMAAGAVGVSDTPSDVLGRRPETTSAKMNPTIANGNSPHQTSWTETANA